MTTTTNRSAALARMADLVARWSLAAGVTPVTAEAHPRARDVFVAVEASCAGDAAVIAAAMRLACANDVMVYEADDDAPAMVTGAFSDASLATLIAKTARA